MGWTPEKGFIPAQWDRYNEATLLYLLALGSPTHPIAPEIWTRYTAEFDKSWGMHWGQQHMHFPPMFGHQYSHVWVDFKGIADPWLRAKRHRPVREQPPRDPSPSAIMRSPIPAAGRAMAATSGA